MSSRRPSTSPLLQLIDALNRSVDPEHHTRLIADALDKAEMVDLPEEPQAFRAFISGPLHNAAQTLLGEDSATELTWTLMRMTSVRAPSSRGPGASDRARQTMEYSEDAFAPRTDVLVVDASDSLFDELRIHLEARDYSVAHTADGNDLSSLDRDAPPRAVIYNLALEEALASAEKLVAKLGDRAPGILVLTKRDDRPDAPAGVRIMTLGTLAPIVTAIIEIVGNRSTRP